jgi:steroid delta-isomerase-like uncharacterized protein
MLTEDNKAIVRRFFAEYDRGNLDGAAETLATDFVNHQSDNTMQNREEFKQLGSAFLKAFPNLQETIEDQVAEGDKVTTRLTFRGTQSGELMGIPPTGRQVTFVALTLDRLVDGKIAERWHLFDTLGMMKQLGVIPPMG